MRQLHLITLSGLLALTTSGCGVNWACDTNLGEFGDCSQGSTSQGLPEVPAETKPGKPPNVPPTLPPPPVTDDDDLPPVIPPSDECYGKKKCKVRRVGKNYFWECKYRKKCDANSEDSSSEDGFSED